MKQKKSSGRKQLLVKSVDRSRRPKKRLKQRMRKLGEEREREGKDEDGWVGKCELGEGGKLSTPVWEATTQPRLFPASPDPCQGQVCGRHKAALGLGVILASSNARWACEAFLFVDRRR